VRIVSWNCQMGFRGAKLDALLALSPDLMVVQECAETDVRALIGEGFAVIWEGENPHKGHAVVARKGLRISLDPCHDPELAYFLPVNVQSPEEDLQLLAIWAFNHRAKTAKRWPLDEALAHYMPFFGGRSAVVVGDFNNHLQWDTPTRPIFQRSLDVLASGELRSSWHHVHGKRHGDEGRGTIYWYRHVDKPYHIDYCFVSSDISIDAAEIGLPRAWLSLSDHCPLVVDLSWAAIECLSGPSSYA
jgi:Endonuclease/Exonuclease/phosphatase family